MAYRRKSASRSTSYRGRKTASRSTYRSRSSSAGRRRSSAGAGRTRRAATRTIRIVVEQAPANAVQRPVLGMVEAPKPRKAAF